MPFHEAGENGALSSYTHFLKAEALLSSSAERSCYCFQFVQRDLEGNLENAVLQKEHEFCLRDMHARFLRSQWIPTGLQQGCQPGVGEGRFTADSITPGCSPRLATFICQWECRYVPFGVPVTIKCKLCVKHFQNFLQNL